MQARAFIMHAIDDHLSRQGLSIKAAMLALQLPGGLHTDAGPADGAAHVRSPLRWWWWWWWWW
jgi:hypothetical protein